MRGTYERFAEILDYPGPRLCDRVSECLSSLAPGHREAARLLCGFLAELQDADAGRLEEVYAGTFGRSAHPMSGTISSAMTIAAAFCS